ncbi:hypothetical protein SAMN05443582_1011170 [Phyllobacterium sp. OV277]|nr:hypothetical protein SAMN05443582_1011170 [Phyllobacterium sp. OV277]
MMKGSQILQPLCYNLYAAIFAISVASSLSLMVSLSNHAPLDMQPPHKKSGAIAPLLSL